MAHAQLGKWRVMRHVYHAQLRMKPSFIFPPVAHIWVFENHRQGLPIFGGCLNLEFVDFCRFYATLMKFLRIVLAGVAYFAGCFFKGEGAPGGPLPPPYLLSILLDLARSQEDSLTSRQGQTHSLFVTCNLNTSPVQPSAIGSSAGWLCPQGVPPPLPPLQLPRRGQPLPAGGPASSPDPAGRRSFVGYGKGGLHTKGCIWNLLHF